MEKIIVKFVRLLRKGGVTVSLSEANDAINALAIFGVTDRHQTYTLLRATLLKSENDKEVFDLVWRICFGGKETFSPITVNKPCSGRDGEKGTAGMNDVARRFYGLIRNGSGQEAAAEIEKRIREADTAELSAADLAEQLKISLGWFMTAYALEENEDEYGLFLLKELENHMNLRCEREIIKVQGEEGVNVALAAKDICHENFAALSEAQVKAMEQRINRLGKKLAGQYSYRLKRAKGGVPDMRRIMADTAHRGHLPIPLPRLDKVKDRVDLVVLCDISGSMGVYSSFCLQLVYAMSRRFHQIRSFLFIESIVETTFDFQNQTVAEAITAAMDTAYPKRTGRNKEHCTTTGISDYGKALEAFHRKFGSSLTDKTAVIVIGDAKSNWFPPRPEELAKVRAGCRKLIWLNPEPKARWDKEDSVVSQYLPYCTVMAECRTLAQLEKVITAV